MYFILTVLQGTTKGTIIDGGGGTYNLGAPLPPEYWSGFSGTYTPIEQGVRYLDINGDGKADIIRGDVDHYAGTTTNEMFLNGYATSTGYAWPGTTWTGVMPQFVLKSDSSHSWTTGIFNDINGDGLPDYEEALQHAGTDIVNGAYVGNGSSWDSASTTIFNAVAPMPDSVSGPTGFNSQLVDINGDGLDDWVYSYLGNTIVAINSGTQWGGDGSAWTISTTTLFSSDGNYYDRGIRFFDLNGDGLPDFIHSYTSTGGSEAPENATYSQVFLNTGSGWATSTAYSLPSYITTGGVTYSYNEYANWTGNGQNAQDVLSTITFPQGGTATITYSKTAQQGTHPELPISLLTVSSIVTNDGLGTTAERDYTYSGGKMYLTNGVRDRKFAGFFETTETTPTTVTNTYFDQGDSIYTGMGEQNDGWGQIGHPFRQDVLDPLHSNQLVRRTFDRWDTATTSGGTFVYKARKLTQSFGSTGDHRDTATDYTYSTTTGNLSQITRYGEVTGSSDGTFSDTGSDKVIENIAYATSTTTQVTGLPYLDTLSDQSSNKVKETRNYYDSLSLGSTTKGNLTKQETWITSSSYASTTKAYNSYGLVATSTDARSNSTTYVYDGLNLYPATTTNPLSQKIQNLYDYSTGKVRQTVDANNATSSVTYDGFGRALTVTEPDPSTGSSVTKTTYAYTDSSTPGSTSVLQTDYLNSATTTATYSYSDGLGRNLQRRVQAQGTNTYGVKDWTYNNFGALKSETLLYFASSSARATATSTGALFTRYTYDPLLRILTTGNAVGTTTNAYGTWTVTTTDPNGKLKDYTKDAYGNLATVVEHISSTLATTTYAYDLNNNLTRITDALGNIRNFTYDGLSRRLTAEDLHASGDGTFGSWTYSYDASSNMTQQVDPRSQTTNYTYDALNRPLSEDHTSQSGTEETYAYDSCTYGKGRLYAATTTNNSIVIATTKAYNPLGLASSETKYVNGQYYTTSYTYDRQGNQTDIVYPDSSEVFYTFDGSARPIKVQQREGSPYSWRTLVSNITYNPLGQETSVIWGSGATTTNTYDANKLYRLTHKVTLLPDSGSWGTGASGDSMGFITSNSSSNASWSSATTPPNVSTNLNTENHWFSNSLSYQDSFENGTSTWIFYLGSSSASSSIDCTTSFSGACSYKVVVSSTSVAYEPDLHQIVRMDPNVNYTLKFRIKASTTTPIEVNLQENHDQYLMWGLDKFPTVTTDWQEFSYYFSSTATTTDKNTRLLFGLGQKKSATYWIDDVELVPDGISTIKAPSFENPTADIAAAWTVYIDSGSYGNSAVDCTNASEGACSEKFTINQTTGADWIMQMYQPQSLTAGQTYVLTFDAKASSQRNAAVYLQQNHDNLYLLSDTVPYTIYPTWNHYTIELTSSDTDPNARIDFNSLASALGNVWIDNVRLFKKQTTKITAPPPHFNGIYDSTGTSTASAYQIQVIQRGGNWASPLWDSGKTTLSPQTAIGSRTATSTYAGTSLPSDGTDANKYFWRMMTWDQSNNPSPWTNGNDFFFTPGNRVQDLSYTYDANGNITRFVDASFTKTAKVVDYTYDDLNRLTQASTTPDIASGAPNAGHNMIEKWSYDSLGNILTDATTTLSGGWATTTYSYAGTSYTNPDAATSIGGVSLSYDNAGNQLTGFGVTKTWDWRNHLGTSVIGATTTIYAYDENDKRARVETPDIVYHYPNDYFSQEWPNNNPTRHVFLNGRSIVTLNGATSSDTVNYTFSDPLNSTGVTADSNNHVQEVTDYAPYGAMQNHDQLAGYSEQRKYIGQFSDATGLSYLNARYYNSAQGQFLSEDPVFLRGQQNLQDPQSLNSYSYANDNPIVKSDPNGKCIEDGCVIEAAATFGFVGGIAKPCGRSPGSAGEAAIV